jgi:magnesium chelatase subunit I
MGKIEIETLEDGRDGQVAEHLVRSAVLQVFKRRVPLAQLRDVVSSFEEGAVVHTGDDVASGDLARLVEEVPALREPVRELSGGDEDPAVVASAIELVLEGLHLSKRLNKDAVGGRATYRSRG